jgi:hypothetical protein
MDKTKLDGRKKAPQLLPRKHRNLTNAQVRRIVENFMLTGKAHHSGNASTLQYIIDYCEDNLIGYQIKALPGIGYSIEKFDFNA